MWAATLFFGHFGPFLATFEEKPQFFLALRAVYWFQGGGGFPYIQPPPSGEGSSRGHIHPGNFAVHKKIMVKYAKIIQKRGKIFRHHNPPHALPLVMGWGPVASTLAINQLFFCNAHTEEFFLVIHTDTQVSFGVTLDTQVEKLADTHSGKVCIQDFDHHPQGEKFSAHSAPKFFFGPSSRTQKTFSLPGNPPTSGGGGGVMG